MNRMKSRLYVIQIWVKGFGVGNWCSGWDIDTLSVYGIPTAIRQSRAWHSYLFKTRAEDRARGIRKILAEGWRKGDFGVRVQEFVTRERPHEKRA